MRRHQQGILIFTALFRRRMRAATTTRKATVDQAKKFFESKGVKVSGGITVTVNERNQFETYCYTNPAHRQKLKEVVEFTANSLW